MPARKHGFFRASETDDVPTPPELLTDLTATFGITHDCAPLGFGRLHHVDGLDPAVPWGGGAERPCTYGNVPFSAPEPWLARAVRERHPVLILMPLRWHSGYFADALADHASAFYTFKRRVTFPGYEKPFQLPLVLVLFNWPGEPPALERAGGYELRRHVARRRPAPAVAPRLLPAGAAGTEHLVTPADLYAALHAVFRFTHDPAPLGYGTDARVADGLDRTVPWGAVNFLHPPHSNIEPWLERAALVERGVTVALVPFRGHTEYWRRLVDSTTPGLYFVRGGIAFGEHRYVYPMSMVLVLFNYVGEPPALDELGSFRTHYVDTTHDAPPPTPAKRRRVLVVDE